MSVATLETTEATAIPVIDFVAPMPGFPVDRHFVLIRVEESGVLFELTSLESDGLRFLVVPPAPFFPDYAPEIDNEVLALLNTKDPDRLLLLTVITAGVNETTANLLAPIVVDRDSMRAMQVVLSGSGLPVRATMNRAY